MADDPADRYGSVALLAADVKRLLDGDQVSVHRPTPIERLMTWGSRNQAAITVVTAYLLMRLILFLVFRT